MDNNEFCILQTAGYKANYRKSFFFFVSVNHFFYTFQFNQKHYWKSPLRHFDKLDKEVIFWYF